MRSIFFAIGMITGSFLCSTHVLSAMGNSKPLKSFDEARDMARKEGKMIFVDFTAKWCAPCRWMEQTTFTDQQVNKILSDAYVHVKIDIDEVSGFELKKLYTVKYLPTLLVFNSNGQMLDRIEETVTPRVLSGILNKHLNPGSTDVKKMELNMAPSTAQNKSDSQSSSNNDPFISSDDFLRYFNHHPDMKTIRIQTGTFLSYEDASAQVRLLREKYNEPINVVNEIVNGAIIFKVLFGQFFKTEDAVMYNDILSSELNIEGVIR